MFKIFALFQQVQSQVIGKHNYSIFLVIWMQKSVNLNPLFWVF